MATEYKLLSFRQPIGDVVPAAVGHVKRLELNQLPKLLAKEMEGWEIMHSQLMPVDDDMMITFTLRQDYSAPDVVDFDG